MRITISMILSTIVTVVNIPKKKKKRKIREFLSFDIAGPSTLLSKLNTSYYDE